MHSLVGAQQVLDNQWLELQRPWGKTYFALAFPAGEPSVLTTGHSSTRSAATLGKTNSWMAASSSGRGSRYAVDVFLLCCGMLELLFDINIICCHHLHFSLNVQVVQGSVILPPMPPSPLKEDYSVHEDGMKQE